MAYELFLGNKNTVCFAPSVIFCTRTSSALITTRAEVSPRLHRALFMSWHGRPPSPGPPMAPNARCGWGEIEHLPLVPYFASGDGGSSYGGWTTTVDHPA